MSEYSLLENTSCKLKTNSDCRFLEYLSLSPIQEGFSFTCMLHNDTNKIFANKNLHSTGSVLSLLEVQRSYIHHPHLSYFHTALCFPEQVQ